jgi:hypothetical protein
MISIVDTFPAFLSFWAEVHHRPTRDQIELWAAFTQSKWPELLVRQIDDYASQDLDWRQIAGEKVFPFISDRLPEMEAAHRNLLELIGPVFSKARLGLDFEFDITFLIHVGLGCGAGWAVGFNDGPAILFDLGNIAECGWSDSETLTGLIAHEIGHLVHFAWRRHAGKPIGTDAWWQLYEEGFAQICESLVSGKGVVHQANPAQADNWLAWCQAHKDWLAAEFLRTVDAGQPVTAFFGSWFEIRGRSETGYFLGQEAMRVLEFQHSFQEIALLEPAEAYLRPILEKMADGQ